MFIQMDCLFFVVIFLGKNITLYCLFRICYCFHSSFILKEGGGKSCYLYMFACLSSKNSYQCSRCWEVRRSDVHIKKKNALRVRDGTN